MPLADRDRGWLRKRRILVIHGNAPPSPLLVAEDLRDEVYKSRPSTATQIFFFPERLSTLNICQSLSSPIMSTKLHQRPPFRAEHLGSLLRPAALLDVKHKIDNGQKGLEKDLKAIEDTAVKEIVKEQIDIGFHAVSDGEYRRHMFWYISVAS